MLEYFYSIDQFELMLNKHYLVNKTYYYTNTFPMNLEYNDQISTRSYRLDIFLENITEFTNRIFKSKVFLDIYFVVNREIY